MKINQQNYVDEAERVIQSMIEIRRDGQHMPLTTSKLRNLLAMAAELKTDAQHSREAELSPEMQNRIQYLKIRIAYEAGRDMTSGRPGPVKKFIENASLLEYASEIKGNRKALLLFCDYMEALTAYHKYYGGREN